MDRYEFEVSTNDNTTTGNPHKKVAAIPLEQTINDRSDFLLFFFFFVVVTLCKSPRASGCSTSHFFASVRTKMQCNRIGYVLAILIFCSSFFEELTDICLQFQNTVRTHPHTLTHKRTHTHSHTYTHTHIHTHTHTHLHTLTHTHTHTQRGREREIFD